MTDDGGVLGNLPRSRPGQRSEKRKSGTAAKAGANRAARAAKPARGPEPRSAGRPKPAAGGDPVGGAIRTVTGLAGTGARVAGGVAREVLRRLPRP